MFTLISKDEKPGNRSLNISWRPGSANEKLPTEGNKYTKSPDSIGHVYQLGYFDDDHPIAEAAFAKNVSLTYRKVPTKKGDPYEIDFSFTVKFNSSGDLNFSGIVSGTAK